MPHEARVADHCAQCGPEQPPVPAPLMPFIVVFFGLVCLYLHWKGWL